MSSAEETSDMPGKEKVAVDLNSACRLLQPSHTVLVSCVGKRGIQNIITLAWAMPTSINPPLVAVSIAPRRYSHGLIEETKEFVINVPTMDILKATVFCGRRSGRDVDKFKETGLTALAALQVHAPTIKECVAHLECRLHSQFTTGDHTIFVGEIIEAYADKEAFEDGYNLRKAKMVFHLGGDEFATLATKVFKPRLSRTKKTGTRRR
jgi:flavin reductase (DIM6/NTAB) family NADH-FMN oxidoreductase RutF